MALQLTEQGVTLNEIYNEMLKDLQGNILKHHGRRTAYHFLIRFDTNKENIKRARTWIKSFANANITSAKKQLSDAQVRKFNSDYDGGTFYTLSLSSTGYQKLGIPNTEIPNSESFMQGMLERHKNLLDDVSKYQSDFTTRIDALIIVADASPEKALSQSMQIEQELGAFVKEIFIQKGEALKNEHGIGIEHFGYADGVSQPLFLKEEIEAQVSNKNWHDAAPLNTLLVKDPGGKYEDSFGSYLVFRKLEQNVAGFKKQEAEINKLFNNKEGIKNANGKPDKELAGAMLVGRFEDGTEVTNSSEEREIKTEAQLNNDFIYTSDKTGSKCPYHAHIRMTNPRSDIHDQHFVKNSRITRRGIPYNDIGRDINDFENDKPIGGVGLLFMCYQSDIEAQFERIQSQFSNKGDINGGKTPAGAKPRPRVAIDGIIGQIDEKVANDKKKAQGEPIKLLPAQWGHESDTVEVKFNGFVTNKGGEYFFTPSISFLRSL